MNQWVGPNKSWVEPACIGLFDEPPIEKTPLKIDGWHQTNRSVMLIQLLTADRFHDWLRWVSLRCQQMRCEAGGVRLKLSDIPLMFDGSVWPGNAENQVVTVAAG